jgi:uncharacterized protein YacL
MFNLTQIRTYVIDFATLADGRVVALAKSGLLAGRVIVPDIEACREASTTLVERARTTLEQLGKDRNLKVRVARSALEPEELLEAARRNKARIITVNPTPYSLLSTPSPVPVTVLDDLFEVLKPVYLPGTELVIKIVKRGKEADEGIGYLEGGIKVVVENGAGLVGKEADVVIQGALDTQVGRVVFAKPKYSEVR